MFHHLTPASEVPNEFGPELMGRWVAVVVVDPIGRAEAELKDSFAVGAEGMTAVEADHSFVAEVRDIEVLAEQPFVVEVQCNRLEVCSSSCSRSICKRKHQHNHRS